MPKKQRPEVIEGKTYKIKTNCGNLYLTLSNIEKVLGETKIQIGKSGTCQNLLLKVIAILFSILFQEDYTAEQLFEMMKKHFLGEDCGNPFIYKGKRYKSCIDLAVQFYMKEFKNAQKAEKARETRRKKKEQTKTQETKST